MGDRAFDLAMAQCHPGCSTNAALTAFGVGVYKSLLTAAAETYARLSLYGVSTAQWMRRCDLL